MAQFARPVGDITDGNWLNQAGSAVNMFQSIDETVASDTDYVESDLAPVNSPVVFDLSTVEDPLSSSGHIMRWRRQKSSSAGAQIDLTIQLRQGYVSEVSQGTLIKSVNDTNIPNPWADNSATLSAGEADAITDYGDLQYRFVANQV